MRKFLVISILLVFISPLAHANSNDCQPVDLRAEFGPPRDQGNIGWCYSHAAADLLEHYFRKDLRAPISAKHIALSSNYHWIGHNFSEHGSMLLSIQYILEQGTCSSEIDKLIFGINPSFKVTEKINSLYEVFDYLKAGHNRIAQDKLLRYQSQWGAKINPYQKAILEIMRLSNKANVIGNIYDFLCKNNQIKFSNKPRLRWRSILKGNFKSSVIETLNEQLSLGKPVGMTYFFSIFKNTDEKKTSSGLHESLIVGRRWNKSGNSCQYLVRNTWSTRCTGYKDPGVRANCENGYVWLDFSNLSKHLIGITYFDDQD